MARVRSIYASELSLGQVFAIGLDGQKKSLACMVLRRLKSQIYNLDKKADKMEIKNYMTTAAAVATLALSAASSSAISFSLSSGTQPSNVGVITLTQVNSTTVDVLVDLLNTSYGFINTGGPHTPFAFNLAGSLTGVSASFINPAGGTYTSGTFSLNLSGGDNTPFGTFGVAIDSTAGNGSGNGYFGDLEFKLSRTGGLSVSDFVANSDSGSYFSADLSNGSNTGAQAWKTPDRSVPDGGMTVLMLGSALAGLGAIARRLKK
jgi:hypothetical protein